MSKESDKQAIFEQTILPHLDAAYNLAHWMLNNDQDAEDVVQEAYLRAYKYFAGFKGGNSRAWLLSIVRNECYSWLHQNRLQSLSIELNEDLTSDEVDPGNPEYFLQLQINHQWVAKALENLPLEYRELIVLREMEEMSYKEIALIAAVPIGTVMSRLARARQKLKECLNRTPDEEGSHEL